MKAWLMAKKDLLIYARDRIGLLLGFGLPIGIATVFGAAMGGLAGGDDVGRATLYVEDRDASDASRALVDALSESDGLRLRLIDPLEDVDEDGTGSARERVANGHGPAGLVVPEGYGEAVAAGEMPPLTLYRDPGKQIEQQIIAGSMLPALFEASGEALGHHAMMKSLDWMDFPETNRAEAEAILEGSWTSMYELVERVGLFEQDEADLEPAEGGDAAEGDTEESDDSSGGEFDFSSMLSDALGLEVEDVVGGDDAPRARRVAQQAHAVAGIAVMMLLFGLVACGGTLLDEEAGGTLERLRLAPGAAAAILGGKFLFTWIVGLSQLLILFVFGLLVFDIPIFRAPVALVVLSACVAASATGFGILFAVLCRSRKQLEGLSTLVILLMSALGGSWFPLVITPDWYQFLGHFTLTAWAMDAYQAIFWYELGLTDILVELGVLLAIAAATSALALRLWNRRQRA